MSVPQLKPDGNPGSQKVADNESETFKSSELCAMQPWAQGEELQQPASEEARALNCKERLQPKLSQS